MKKFFILFIFLIPICACIEDDNDENKIEFTGISEYNEDGAVNGELDNTDWNFNDEWEEQEQNLFGDLSLDICTYDESSFSIMAFPNPCTDKVNLNVLLPFNTSIMIKLVDKDFNVIYENDEVVSSRLQISMDYFDLENEIVRVYYKMIGESCELRGHGDIQVN